MGLTLWREPFAPDTVGLRVWKEIVALVIVQAETKQSGETQT